MKARNVLIVYFSGTGNTKYAAELLEERLLHSSCSTKLHPIDLSIQSFDKIYSDITDALDMLIVLYPVYAFSLPLPVHNWINAMPTVEGLETVVLSVSGGGEIWPNSLSRVDAIKLLEAKGCNVFYENMLVMPSNILVETNDDLSMWILKYLPEKINGFAEDILHNKVKRKRTHFGITLSRLIAGLERVGSKGFGLSLHAKNNCDGCRWCSENCPVNNIAIVNGKPVFLDDCIICLRCVYGCPKKAIYSTKYPQFILQDGFNLLSIEQRMHDKELRSISESSKGLLWIGVKKYLLKGK